MIRPTPVHVPLARGVDLGPHKFALELPSLAVAENCDFSEPGCIKKRHGHIGLGGPPTPTLLTVGTGSAATSFATDSIAPSASALILVWVTSKISGGAPAAPSLSGNGLTWVQVATVQFDSNNSRMTLFRAMGTAPTAGAITISFGATSQTSCVWHVHQWTGAATSGTNGSGAIAQSSTQAVTNSLTLSRDLASATAGNALAIGTVRDTDESFTGEDGWEEWTDITSAALDLGQRTFTRAGVTDLTFSTDTMTQLADGAAIMVEIVAAPGGIIDGGGTLSDIKGLAVRDDELVCFADGKVYSWSTAIEKWLDRGAYEGVEPTVKTVCQKPAEQVYADRARYSANGKTVDVYAWYESVDGAVHVQVFDASTGTPLCGDTSLGADTSLPRCLAIDNTLQVYYWDVAASRVKMKAIDALNVSGTIGNAALTVSGATHATFFYDVCKRGSTQSVMAYRESGGNYEMRIINEAGTVVTSAAVARAANSAIAVAFEPNNNRIAVFRYQGAGNDLVCDILNGTTLADVSFSTPIENNPGPGGRRQITAAFRETSESGDYNCVVFYSTIVTITATVNVVKAKTINTAAAVANLAGPSGSTYWAIHADIGTRAFARGLHVYFGCFAYQSSGVAGPPTQTVQVDYIIYRDDGLPVARFAPWIAAGPLADPHLPQVEALGSDRFAMALAYRNRLSLDRETDGAAAYSDRGIKDVIIDFDSAVPYRGVQLGRTLYMPGGYVAAYDGQGVTEAGFFHVTGFLQMSSANASGTLTGSGAYGYKSYRHWRNAQGERDLSSTVSLRSITLGATDDTVTINLRTYPHSLKRTTGRAALDLIVYRTEANAADALYRVTNPDPTDTSGANCFVVNDPTTDYVAFVDEMPDTTLIGKEPDPLNSGELDPISPDPCTVMAEGQGRLFLAGFENPDLVMYSKIWEEGLTAQFNDALTLILPRAGGRVTAIAPLDSAVVIFKQHRIYMVAGTGPNNLGQGSYGDPQLIPCDTGCEDQRTVVNTPMGVIFKSPKGWRLLNLGGSVQDIGGPVDDYDSQTFVAALLLEEKDIALFVASSGKSLAYNYVEQAWSTWTNPVGLAAVNWNGGYVYCDSTKVYRDQATKTDPTGSYQRIVETPWIKTAGIQGFGSVMRYSVIGEYVAAHVLRVKYAVDFNDTWVDNNAWTVDTADYRVRVQPSKQKVTAFKVRLEDEAVAGGELADSSKLVALSCEIGVYPGLARQPSGRSI